MAAKSKLTENMTACLKVLAQRHPERIWRAAEFPYRSNHSMTALEKRGMVDHDMYAGYGITSAGAEAIGRADLFAAAQPEAGSDAASISDFDPGDEVVIKSDVDCDIPFDGEKLRVLRDNRVVGTVLSIRELPFGNPIAVQFPGEKFSFQPEELELWKPADATPAGDYSVQIGTMPEGLPEGSTTTWTAAELVQHSDTKDEYTRDEEQVRLLARLRELEEALEPFAKVAESMNGHCLYQSHYEGFGKWSYSPILLDGNEDNPLSASHLRAAAEVLAEPVGE